MGGGCMTSGLGGVYLEKVLKQSDMSIWMRNIQLAMFGSILAILGVMMQDYAAVRASGFNQGYSFLVWAVIFVQAVGGLIVAAVMKYADNILKCFGNAVSIIVNCFLSHSILHEFEFDLQFLGGTALVILSTTMYNLGAPSIKWPLRNRKKVDFA